MAAQLGEVTHVANHFEIEETMSDGKVVKKILRDSVEKPKCVNSPPPIPRPTPMKPPKPKAIRSDMKAWAPDEAPSKRARVATQTRKRAVEAAAVDQAALAWRAPPASSSTASAAPTPTAVTAFSRILKRVRGQNEGDDHAAKWLAIGTSSAPPVDVVAEARRILKRAREQDTHSVDLRRPRMRADNTDTAPDDNDSMCN